MTPRSSASASSGHEVTEPPGGLGAEADARDLSVVIGHHVRTFRKERGLSLRGLADRSGLSVGFLSQLERGLSSIGLTTLRHLATTLGHEIVEFFDETSLANGNKGEPGDKDEADDAPQSASGMPSAREGTQPPSADRYFTLTRSTGENSAEYISGQRTYRMLSNRAPGLVLEPMLVSIAPGGVVAEQEAHEGEEFAYVLKGELSYTVDGTEHRLRAGDSLHLLSAIPHRLRNDTDEVALVVSVVTPRLF